MRKRPRLLFLCQTLPFPPDEGVKIRTFNVLRLLSRDFDITGLCFFRLTDGVARDKIRSRVGALREFASVEAFPIPQEHSRFRLVSDHLRSIWLRRPYTLFAYESRDFRQRLEQLVATTNPDLVHVDSLDLSAYLPVATRKPTVCVHHNVESQLLRRRGKAMRGPLGNYLELQANLMQREEIEWGPKVALNVMVSAQDRDSMAALSPTSRTIVVPNGVDTRLFSMASREGRTGIVFVGGYTWQPNRDAMAYFCEEVLPRLRRGGFNGPVTWVGRAPESVREEYRRNFGVVLTGYVEDIRPVVQGAACYVVPLRSGGGTRLKILDAWAMGMPVVSTSVGCEGLATEDGENILVRDDPSAFADAVQLVLRDPERQASLGRGARATAERLYDWEVIGREMLPHYHGVLEDGASLL
jgi:glycosyltransferase involved in cell wall biosynthesis